MRTTFNTGFTALGGFGVYQDITSLASYSIEDPSVALVGPDGSVYSVSVGKTVLRISYQHLSLEIPVTVSEKVNGKRIRRKVRNPRLMSMPA